MEFNEVPNQNTVPEALQNVTALELERARQGTEDFKKTLEKSSLIQKVALKVGIAGEKLQMMFLGLRPMGDFIVDQCPTWLLASFPLPERFKRSADGYTIYDAELVSRVVSEPSNKEYFPDAGNYPSIEAYMNHRLTRPNWSFKAMFHTEISQMAPEQQRKIADMSDNQAKGELKGLIRNWHIQNGLLFGFPLSEVLDYADSAVDGNSDYLQSSSLIKIKGFHFRNKGEAGENFKSKVKELYQKSGMEKVVRSFK